MKLGMKRAAYVTILTGLFGVGFATAIGLAPPAASTSATGSAQDSRALESVSAECWAQVRSKRIYFAHQSVGSNMLKGVKVLLDAHSSIGLSVMAYRDESKRSSSDPKPFAQTGLVQGPAGANGAGGKKIDAFVEFLRSPIAAEVDIAILKLCYADVGKSTDVDALFREYAAAIKKLKRDRPTLQIVHCTVPLKAPETGAKARVKKLVGSGTESANASRGRFNELVRTTYEAATICDVARAESIRGDRTECTVTVDGVKWPALVPEYTDDGGHLNAIGQVVVAREFLLALSRQCSEVTAPSQPSEVKK